MTIEKAEQAILNAIYAALAWLLLDLGLMLQQHGSEIVSVLAAQPEMVVGVVAVIACIAGLIYKSRVAAILLFLFFLLPQLLRVAGGAFPSTMMLIFFLLLLYFFLNGVFGAFRYHHLKRTGGEQADRSG